jgi:hypothetical protein
MTCEKSVRPVFTVMPPIGKIEEFTAKPPRRVQIDTKQNTLQILDNTRLFRQTSELNRTAVLRMPKMVAAELQAIL